MFSDRMFSRAIHKTSNLENTQEKYIQSTRLAVFTMYRYTRQLSSPL